MFESDFKFQSHSEAHRQVEVYEVPGEIIAWDHEICEPPQNPIALFIKMDNTPPDPNSPLHPVKMDAIYHHGRTIGQETNFLYDLGFYYHDRKGTSNYFNSRLDELTGFRSLKQPTKANSYMFWGLLDEASALEDHFNQKKLKKIGIRTHESLGIIRVKYIYIGNSKYSLDSLKKGITVDGKEIKLPGDFSAVQQVRFYGTPYRIEDLKPNPSKEPEKSTEQKLLEAMAILGNDRDVGKMLDPISYLETMIQLNARNLGRMHNCGLLHRFAHSGNFTLDGRVVDTDSIKSFKEMADDTSKIYGDEEKIRVGSVNTMLYKDLHQTVANMKSLLTHLIQSFPEVFAEIYPSIKNLETEVTQNFIDQYLYYAGRLYEIDPSKASGIDNLKISNSAVSVEINTPTII